MVLQDARLEGAKHPFRLVRAGKTDAPRCFLVQLDLQPGERNFEVYGRRTKSQPEALANDRARHDSIVRIGMNGFCSKGEGSSPTQTPLSDFARVGTQQM